MEEEKLGDDVLIERGIATNARDGGVLPGHAEHFRLLSPGFISFLDLAQIRGPCAMSLWHD